MTTSPTASVSSPPRTARVPLRLRLAETFPAGPLDGAWWPQSRDLHREAADLVDHFPHPIGRVSRLLFSRPDWDAAPGTPSPHSIRAARGAVKVGSFPSDDTHLMVAKLASGQRLRLLVIPSDTEPGLASRIMEQTADGRNTQSPGTLLGLSGAGQGRGGHAVWDGDGGSPA